MLTRLVRLLAPLARLVVIVFVSVAAGVAVALLYYNVDDRDNPLLGAICVFAVFATPVVVAWLLFNIVPPVSPEPRNATDPCTKPSDANGAATDCRAEPIEESNTMP